MADCSCPRAQTDISKQAVRIETEDVRGLCAELGRVSAVLAQMMLAPMLIGRRNTARVF